MLLEGTMDLIIINYYYYVSCYVIIVWAAAKVHAMYTRAWQIVVNCVLLAKNSGARLFVLWIYVVMVNRLSFCKYAVLLKVYYSYDTSEILKLCKT